MLGTDRRFRSGGRESSNCSLSSCTVPSSKHAGTTAKPSFSTNSLKPLSLLVSLRVNVGYLGRILCPIGWAPGLGRLPLPAQRVDATPPRLLIPKCFPDREPI